MQIFGSGISGCLAAILFPDARVFEEKDQPTVNHQAVLRMRSDVVEKFTGIKLKPVRVTKWIDRGNGDITNVATFQDIVCYSLKTNGSISERSIAHLDPEVRYIPPETFHEQLLEKVSGRIHYDHKVTDVTGNTISAGGRLIERTGPIISTFPLPVTLKLCGMENSYDFKMESQSIYVTKYRVKEYNMYCTIYYPNPDVPIYRMSISGDIITMESMSEIDINSIQNMMPEGADWDVEVILHNFKQLNGKLIPISEDDRKTTLHRMTQDLDLYSLGRFACWRQVLVDDSVSDLKTIQRMIKTHPYDRSK